MNNNGINTSGYFDHDITDFLRASGDRWNLSESGFLNESHLIGENLNDSQTFVDNTFGEDPINTNNQIEFVINNITIMLDQLFKDIEETKPYHIQVLNSLVYEDVKLLNKKYNESRILIQNALQELSNIENMYILLPPFVQKLGNLVNRLELSLGYITLLINETEIENSKLLPQRLCLFYIQKCPFPSLYIKNNQLIQDDSVHIQVLTSPCVEIVSASQIKCRDICHSNFKNANKVKSIVDNDSCIIDQYTYSSEYKCTFSSGSRKDIAQLEFSISVRTNISDEEIILTTPPSKPFIVITNECQFGESLSILFQKDVYEIRWAEPVEEVSWEFFANNLQTYFLKSTRQDLYNPQRGLYPHDFMYLHQVFFNSAPYISRSACQKFWAYFGKILHKLRYQRHMSTMWCQGLLYGFINRENSNNFLAMQRAGSFIIRFSESNFGALAISFKEDDINIRNILVKQEDIVGSIKSLADFIGKRPEFSYIIQFTGIDQSLTPCVQTVEKDFAFHSLYSVQNKQSNNVEPKSQNPYDELKSLPN